MLKSLFEHDAYGQYGPQVQRLPREQVKWAGQNLNYPSDMLTDHRISAKACMLWFHMMEYTDSNDEITASTRELSHLIRGSASTIVRLVKMLEAAGYLEVTRKNKSHSTYALRINNEPVQWPDGYKAVVSE